MQGEKHPLTVSNGAFRMTRYVGKILVKFQAVVEKTVKIYFGDTFFAAPCMCPVFM